MFSKIENPYTFTDEEKLLIRDNYSVHTDWDKSVFDDVKSNITQHLRNEQNNECCYCRQELGFDIGDVHIDHIVPKSDYNQFGFEARNLALSCHSCNIAKSSSSTIKKGPIHRYPRTGTNITIIHSYYDDYNDHVEILDNSIYSPLSDKGCETIRICKLYRLRIVENNKRKFESQKSKSAELVEIARTCTKDSPLFQRVIDAIKHIIS